MLKRDADDALNQFYATCRTASVPEAASLPLNPTNESDSGRPWFIAYRWSLVGPAMAAAIIGLVGILPTGPADPPGTAATAAMRQARGLGLVDAQDVPARRQRPVTVPVLKEHRSQRTQVHPIAEVPCFNA